MYLLEPSYSTTPKHEYSNIDKMHTCTHTQMCTHTHMHINTERQRERDKTACLKMIDVFKWQLINPIEQKIELNKPCKEMYKLF